MRKIITIPGLILLLAFAGCKDPYFPPVNSLNKKLLVVEGTLNLSGPTRIRVSRSGKVDRDANVEMETNATVRVEGSDNSVETLSIDTGGQYRSEDLHMSPTNQYRVRINTLDGKEYVSAFLTPIITPEIDSISWVRNTDGVQVSLNTHDPSNNTRYYRWEYDEAWEFYSTYNSSYIFKDPNVVPRQIPEELVYDCFKYRTSPSILLGNTTRLAEDIVSNEPLVFIPQNTEKLTVRYSILLRQFALDKESNAFYELLRKNSESIGTIFDSQPSDFKGNLTCVTDPTEQCLGYLTACAIREKRIFINNTDVLPWYLAQACEKILVPKDSFGYYFKGGAYVPYEYDYATMGYFSSSANCVDCTARGGTTKKPSYW